MDERQVDQVYGQKTDNKNKRQVYAVSEYEPGKTPRVFSGAGPGTVIGLGEAVDDHGYNKKRPEEQVRKLQKLGNTESKTGEGGVFIGRTIKIFKKAVVGEEGSEGGANVGGNEVSMRENRW